MRDLILKIIPLKREIKKRKQRITPDVLPHVLQMIENLDASSISIAELMQ